MGFFGKKKRSDHHQTTKAKPPLNSTGKSVRFAASPVSDDDGGFATDSELEVNRTHRQVQSKRDEPPKVHAIAPKPSANPREYVRSSSYSERQTLTTNTRDMQRSEGLQSYNQRSGSGLHYASSVDEDYMSESESSIASFSRGTSVRSSLPILRPTAAHAAYPSHRPLGLVFLTFNGETKKAVLPSDMQSLDTVKAMFLRAFPSLSLDTLESSRRRFYILDRASNKFSLLVHLQDIKDGSMLKLVDIEVMTPSSVRRSHSAHSGLANDSIYFSEPECDVEKHLQRTTGYQVQRPLVRMALTKETNIDEPVLAKHHVSQSMDSKVSSLTRNTSTALQNVNHRSPTHAGAQFPGPLYADSHTSSQPSLGHLSQLSTGYSTKLGAPLSLVSPDYGADADNEVSSVSDSGTSAEMLDERQRMAKMEAQIANLTSWVHTALSRPSSAASDKQSDISLASSRSKDFTALAKMLGMSAVSSDTPQPELGPELQQKIRDAAAQARELKSEIKKIKRIHQAQAESVQDTLKDAFTRIQNAIAKIPGAKDFPLRTQRDSVNVELLSYETSCMETVIQISDLEASVSELRTDVVSRRCHVNIGEVEALALKLSKATRSATDIKLKFPRLQNELKQVMIGEKDMLLQQETFLKKEPEKIEDALKRCKGLMNVLHTLKRLAVVQDHRSAVVPVFKTKPIEQLNKKEFLDAISRVVPNHEGRIKAIEMADKAVERRRNIFVTKETLKFEKSLELATKNLKEADGIPKTNIDNSTVLQPVEIKGESEHIVLTSDTGAISADITKRKPLVNNSFVQNRDSIHWDGDSDEDASYADEDDQFIDVTEAPLSAFAAVAKRNGHKGNSSVEGKSPAPFFQALASISDSSRTAISAVAPVNVDYAMHSTTLSGPVYASNDQQRMEEGNRKRLQDQYYKLQQLQRDFHHNIPQTLPGPTHVTPDVKSAKPAVAPKPQFLVVKPQMSNRTPVNDCTSRSITTIHEKLEVTGTVEDKLISEQIAESKSTTV